MTRPGLLELLKRFAFTWHDWKTIKTIYQHTFTTCFLIACTKILFFWGHYGVEDPFNRCFLEHAERLTFVLVIAWGIMRLSIELWENSAKTRGSNRGILSFSFAV